MNTLNKKKMRTELKKIDLFNVNREWVYTNYDQLVDLVVEWTDDEVDISSLNLEDEIKIYDDYAMKVCAKIVGEIFGLEVNFRDIDGTCSMIEYDVYLKAFGFHHEFLWVIIKEVPEFKIRQDPRMLELAQIKRNEFIKEFKLRERIKSWFDNDCDTIKRQYEFLNASDPVFIYLIFREMNEIVRLLIDEWYLR